MSNKTKRKIIIVVVILISLLVYINRSHTITFDTMGGTTLDSVKVKNNKLLSRPETPIRDGFRFDDWYYDGQVFDFDMKINKSMTIVARWIKLVDYKPNHMVILALDEMGNVNSIMVEDNKPCPRPENPVMEGRVFDNWYYNGQVFDFNTPITENIILIANWK